MSKILTFKARTFIAPAAVAPPSSGSLFIVGDATLGGWDNPVLVPSQQFTEADSLTYVGTFTLNSGRHYLFLPINGSWGSKYGVVDNSLSGLYHGGVFGYYSDASPTIFNSNFPAPDSTGTYQIKVDFLRGKFTVTKQ